MKPELAFYFESAASVQDDKSTATQRFLLSVRLSSKNVIIRRDIGVVPTVLMLDVNYKYAAKVNRDDLEE